MRLPICFLALAAASAAQAATDPYPIPSMNPVIAPQEMSFQTSDGETIAGDFYHLGAATDTAIVVGPGFAQTKGTPLMQSLSAALAHLGDTLCIDFRGTGKSTGTYDFGATGELDLLPALEHFRKDYSRVIVVGLSLGAYSALIASSDYPDLIDRALVISAPTSVDDIVWGGSFWSSSWYFMIHPDSPEEFTGANWLFHWGDPFTSKPNAKDRAPYIVKPVDFLVGSADPLVPPAMSRSIYDQISAAAHSWTELSDGHHAEAMYLVTPDRVIQWASDSLSSP